MEKEMDQEDFNRLFCDAKRRYEQVRLSISNEYNQKEFEARQKALTYDNLAATTQAMATYAFNVGEAHPDGPTAGELRKRASAIRQTIADIAEVYGQKQRDARLAYKKEIETLRQRYNQWEQHGQGSERVTHRQMRAAVATIRRFLSQAGNNGIRMKFTPDTMAEIQFRQVELDDDSPDMITKCF